LKVTYLCGVYCRFCFRRYKVSNGSENPSIAELKTAIQYIRDHPEIREVILTGGDPLTLSDSKLFRLFAELNSISHLQVIRVHTRMPLAVPSRITDEFLELISSFKLPVWFVLHINHASELGIEARSGIKKLNRTGVPLLSQSVLLKGVNDCLEVLLDLLSTLVQNKIQPYYLHYPDLAQGTSQFRIPLSQAVELVSQLQGKISGFAIPKLVVDIPGGHGKIGMDLVRYEEGLHDSDAEEWIFTSPLTGEKIRVRYPREESQ
jgi:lysine 2,3-aminomutase